jgi:hypothetical protein
VKTSAQESGKKAAKATDGEFAKKWSANGDGQ